MRPARTHDVDQALVRETWPEADAPDDKVHHDSLTCVRGPPSRATGTVNTVDTYASDQLTLAEWTQPSKPWPNPAGGRSCAWCGVDELPATSIADHFGEVTRSAISQHLGVLKAAGLVSERRDGTRRLYQARQEEMRKLRDFLDDYWTTGLERLRDAAEAAQREKEASDGRTRP